MSNENISAVADVPKPGTKDALKAENEALKAELEAAKAEIEAQKTRLYPESEGVAANDEPKEERVDLYVPKGYANDEPNQLISVNGVNYLLPKGKTSKVPKFVADEFHRARKAQEALDKRMDEMLEASK